MKYPELIRPDVSSEERDRVIDELRATEPVYWCDHDAIGAWLVTGYDDVFSFFKDDRLEFGSTRAEIMKQPKEEQGQLQHLLYAMDNLMSSLPRDRHKNNQKAMMDFLSMATLRDFRKDIIYIIEKVIDRIKDNPQPDMVREFSYPIPANVIAAVMGVPEKDWDQFIEWSAPVEAIFWPYDFEKYKKAGDALVAMMNYFKEMMPEAAARGDKTLLAAYGKAVNEGVATEDEALMNCAAAMFAGHETTATMINAGILRLFSEPTLLGSLQEAPDLMPNVAAEVLRYRPAIGWMRRTATESFEYKGKHIKQGDVLYLGTYAANHDPTYFSNPHEFDIYRKNQKPIMTFGIGKHYCLGAALGKMEIELALEKLIAHFPTMQLDLKNVEYTPTMMLMSNISHLPLKLR